MIYSSQDLKNKMAEVAPTLPKTAAEVRATREKMFAARDAIPEYEARIAEARRTRNLWNIDALEANLEQAREDYATLSHELQRIGSYGQVLEAQERVQALTAQQERQREADQLANAAMLEAEAKADTRIHYLNAGGTPAQFEKSWPSLWAAELERGTLTGTDALRARLLQSGKYS
jgi:chromosome segregation ATPase